MIEAFLEESAAGAGSGGGGGAGADGQGGGSKRGTESLHGGAEPPAKQARTGAAGGAAPRAAPGGGLVVDLGDNKRCTVQVFKGRTQVDLREYYE
eukprot:350027-Chlamydomonas_euryale.AAC.1